MRALETIAQVFDRCAAARVKASLVLCIAALILSPLAAHAETAALQYDNNGNITQRSVTNGATTQTTTYTYDPLNRLTGESGPAKTQTITYDENGNRLSDDAGSYVYETTSNRMSTRLGLAVTFDTAGNMTADGTGRTFAYNQANQLNQVLQGGILIASYYYDANGLRSRKVTTASAPQGAQTILYEYDEEGHLIGERSGMGAPLHTYAWRDDTPVAQIDYQPSRRVLHFDPDHLNTPRAAMDETGKVVWRWESDAFGSTTPNEDADGDGNLTTINLRIGGYQYADVESGLFYNGHRYYSPLLKIFTQTDRLDLLRQAVNPIYAQYSEPTDLQRALNQPFNYVGNNPMSEIDPLGLDPANGRGFSTHYGNWCGKNWSSGKSGPIISSNPEGPVDSLDSCCMAHDYCYAKLEDKMCSLSKDEKKKAFKECNDILAKCSKALSSNGVGWPSPPKNTSDAYYYKQKLQTVFK